VVVDDKTLQFYSSNAEAYAEREIATHTRLTGFLALLPPGGKVLELGCGAGAMQRSSTRRTASGTRGQTIWKIASASTT
jgi:cyclopropane fatty-acyl-phospholipid synthase-like methyltransferase